MRELIHIRAGNFSNFVATHYFNTLEAYFGGPESATEDVDHNISFREGLAPDGSETFCPRLLLFDWKQNFGPLAKISPLYADGLDVAEESVIDVATWDGAIEVDREPPISKHEYQDALDEPAVGTADNLTELLETPAEVRYWSDYNRVFHAPRSLHPLNPPPTVVAGNIVTTWESAEEGNRIDSNEAEIISDDLRHALEECDLLQGFEVSFDTDSFGHLIIPLLDDLREEMPKQAVLSFPILDDSLLKRSDAFSSSTARRIVNEANAIYRLHDLSNLSVPLLTPSASWNTGPWSSLLPNADFTKAHHTAAILATLQESLMLPLRLRNSEVDLRTLCDHLQGTENLHFAQLCGSIPGVARDKSDFERYVYDFTSSDYTAKDDFFAQWSVVRGFDESEQRTRERVDIMNHPYARTSKSSIAHPIPSSYPQFFDTRLLDTRGRLHLEPHSFDPALLSSSAATTSAGVNRVKSVSIYSALRTTSALGRSIAKRAMYLDEFLAKGRDVGILGSGMDRDDLKQLKEDLMRMAEAYGMHGADDGSGGSEFEAGGEDDYDL